MARADHKVALVRTNATTSSDAVAECRRLKRNGVQGESPSDPPCPRIVIWWHAAEGYAATDSLAYRGRKSRQWLLTA
jgi:hypothetical protein